MCVCVEVVIGKVWEGGEIKEKMKELVCLCACCVFLCVCVHVEGVTGRQKGFGDRK